MELRLPELLKRWKAGQFAPVYYLLGEEASAKGEAVDQLKKLFKADDFNLREFSGDVDQEAAAIVSESMTLPIFAERRLIIVKNQKISAAAKEIFAEYLKDPLKTTTLVLLGDDKRPDAKDPLAKTALALGGLCLFSPLSEDDARARLLAEAKRHGKTLSAEAAAVLVSEAGTDWSILGQEIEKLVLFVSSSPEILADDALACLGYRKAANPWTIGDLVERRDLKGALTHLQNLVKDGKAEEQARGALYKIRDIVSRQLKARRMQRAKVSADEIARAVRLYNPYHAREFLGRAAKFSETRLRRDLKRCLRAETDLNSKSWLDARTEVEQLLIDVCGTA